MTLSNSQIASSLSLYLAIPVY